jgi:exodeoxyribonuclease VII small subunit
MATAKAKATPIAAPTFESALSDLEAVIARLERDGLTLDEALGHFEEGVRLMRFCDARLKSARGQLLELTRGESGEFITAILGDGLESFTGGLEDDGDG